MGSASDLERVEGAIEALRALEVEFEVRVLSAHRSPEATARFAREAEARGIRVLLAAAGGAAHLAGTIAAHTPLPVIGIPLDASPLHGLDALLSTVQMPAGIPVACVALGVGGPTNAGVLAAEILALSDEALRRRLVAYRESLARKVEDGDRKVRETLASPADRAKGAPR
jgi:phosphoribosylaminoimidazole carboxylase PurE protein